MERRSNKSTVRPSEIDNSAVVALSKESPLPKKCPEWFSEFDFKHYKTLKGFEQGFYEKELQWQQIKCLELKAQKNSL